MIGIPKPASAMSVYLKKEAPTPRVSQTESMMLVELGLPSDVRKMQLGQVQYLRDCLISKISFPLPQNTVEIVTARGYDWRKEPTLKDDSPAYAIYLDAFVRLNEIHTMIENHEAASRVPNISSRVLNISSLLERMD